MAFGLPTLPGQPGNAAQPPSFPMGQNAPAPQPQQPTLQQLLLLQALQQQRQQQQPPSFQGPQTNVMPGPNPNQGFMPSAMGHQMMGAPGPDLQAQLRQPMSEINPSVMAQHMQPQQWQLNPLQKLLAMLGSYGIGSLLAGGNRKGVPLVGPSAGIKGLF